MASEVPSYSEESAEGCLDLRVACLRHLFWAGMFRLIYKFSLIFKGFSAIVPLPMSKRINITMLNCSIKHKISLLTFLVILLISVSSEFAFTMTSESYFMPTNTIGSAGTSGNSSSLKYKLFYDVRQMSSLRLSESSNYTLHSGYIYTLFADIYIYNVKINSTSAASVNSISGKPVIEADIIDESVTPGSATVEVFIDKTGYFVDLKSAGPNKYHFSFRPASELSSAPHTIEINARNLVGSADYFKIENLGPGKVFTVTSRPKNVPNPFRPSRGEGTTIIYNLSADTGVKLIIYDITGKAVSQKFFSPGTEGGKAGQNNVFWDGKNDFGGYVGNGVYIYFITSGDKILSKGQMAVID